MLINNELFKLKDSDIPKVPIEYSEESRQFWADERKKCIEGYSIGGKWMPGTLYFYINYGTILLNKGENSKTKIPARPFLRDIEWEIFWAWSVARGLGAFTRVGDLGLNSDDVLDRIRYVGEDPGIPLYTNNAKDLILLGSREFGKSFMSSQGIILHEWLFDGAKEYIPGKVETTNIIVGAGDLRYATDLMSKVKLGYDFLAKQGILFNGVYHPHPFMKAFDGSFNKEVTAKYKKKVGGQWLDYGSMSKIKVVSYKDNPFAGQGSRNSVMVKEECGMFGNLIRAQEADTETMKQGTVKFGSCLYAGTGGDFGKGTLDAYRMFYDPDTYDILSFDDTWESKGRIGLFIPATMRPNEFKDSENNTIQEKALTYFLKKREELRNSKNGIRALEAHVQYNPLVPSEMFLRSSGNIFPTIECKAWLAELETNKIYEDAEMICDLIFNDSGKVEPRMDKNLTPIREFPISGKTNQDTSGAIVIWHHPIANDNGEIPWGRYLAGCLLPGEKVLTNRGMVDVQDVSIIDELVNENGDYVKINKLLNYSLVEEDCYTINMVNTLRTTTFTSEHPILISKSKYVQNYKSKHPKYKFNECYWEHDFKYITIDKASKNDWVKIPNIYRKPNDFSINDSWNNNEYRKDRIIESPLSNEDFWWFVGLWLGDGWCQSNEYKISVVFNTNEQYYIDKFSNIVRKLFKREVGFELVSKNCIELSFSFRQLNKFLTNNFGKYAYGKFIPEWAKHINNNYKEQLILGYLAADGCITKHTKGYYSMEFVSISLELLEGIQDMCFALGYVSNLSKLRDKKIHTINKNKPSNTKVTYHLRFGNDDTINFVNSVYNKDDCKLSKVDLNINIASEPRRKQWCYLDDSLEYIYIRIKDITKSKYTGIVYNFECETNTFMCHHITTHNCDPYAQEDAQRGRSLGSIIVLDKFSNRIVAEYTGRPNTLDMFYERCRKLLIYYNAQCLYENQILGVKQHFEHKNSLQYLMFQPEYIKDIIPGSKVDRGYGMHMVQQLRDHGLLLIRDWLQDEYEPGRMNLRTIRSIPFLQELVLFDFDTNVDRISAFIMVMYALKEKHKEIVTEYSSVGIDPFFSRRLFK